jgi:hypothetical protein
VINRTVGAALQVAIDVLILETLEKILRASIGRDWPDKKLFRWKVTAFVVIIAAMPWANRAYL